MMIIGVDYHPSFQTIAFLMEETGECGEQELNHSDGQAEKFYRDLKQRGISVRVGMEATGYSRWFERLLAELGFEVWMGDPAEIKAKRVKKQKFDREDARLLLRLMRENNFPQIWVPGPENRDLRQLLWHRHRMVQMRTRIMNQLQALAMNEGYRWKEKLFSESGRAQLEKLTLAPWASRRRQELLELLDRLNPPRLSGLSVVRVMVFAAGSSLRTQFHLQLHLYPHVTLDTPVGDAWHCNSKRVRVRVLRGTE
jgi:transposase